MITIDQILAEKLAQWTIGEWPIGNFFLCIIALILSIVLCGIIGIEREVRGRSAGLRTHLLVGVGSCIIMIISIYGFPEVFQNHRDVARLAAQVIAGVGFLGAGAIIHRSSGTKGLTTAATIWIVMAIGLACGSFNFILATVGTLLIIVVLTLFRKFETKLTKTSPMIILHAQKDAPILSKILHLANEHSCTLREINSELDDNGNIEMAFLAVANSNSFDTMEFISAIEKIEGIIDITTLNKIKKTI